ncbi:MAG: peptide-methionine (S)-S-oxide reductase [Flavobacteriia bacterium]|nr:MAG: peptide-methionine (S)-S-oxide reductase [Flavobacteriia bacterium]
MHNKIFIILLLTALNLFSQKNQNNMNKDLAVATFGNGCFWCTEAIFQRLKGVDSVLPGYSGGHVKNPAYREVCTGNTGHAEAIQITYDPEIISYRTLLEVFFYTHDPTTLNRQGNDVGTQYRSVIFYRNKKEKEEAENIIRQLTEDKVYEDKIVTEITAFDHFYEAEDYHQDYYNNNKNQPYCRAVINPKIDKFLKKYHSKIR